MTRSLTPLPQNHQALKQIPFLGKNSVPPALRRDLWSPLCVLSFPRARQGLDAFQKLRELKTRHEFDYPLSLIQQPASSPKAGQLVNKIERRRILQDQRPYAVADMAAVLALQARPPSPQELAAQKRRVWPRADRRMRPKRGFGSRLTAAAFEWQGLVDRVGVWWAQVRDAEYARTWPVEVKHGRLAMKRGRPIWPPPRGWAVEEVKVEVEEKEEQEGVKDKVEKVADKAVGWVVEKGWRKTAEAPADGPADGEVEEGGTIYSSAPKSIKWFDTEEKPISQKIQEAYERAAKDLPTSEVAAQEIVENIVGTGTEPRNKVSDVEDDEAHGRVQQQQEPPSRSI